MPHSVLNLIMSMKTALFAAAAAWFCCGAWAAEPSGWTISARDNWDLRTDPSYVFTRGSPAKIAEVERLIPRHLVEYRGGDKVLDRFTFKLVCVPQSSTPSFELITRSLDIRLNDQFRGYVFARMLVDMGQEYSLRGDYRPPARLIFRPLTNSQQQALSSLFMQLREGGMLRIALLQGSNNTPRLYEIPLEGFFAYSEQLLNDCSSFNQHFMGKTADFLPDYVAKEPFGFAPNYRYTLKPQAPTDGLSPKDEEPEEEAPAEREKLQEAKPQAPSPPKIEFFSPGGGRASIGPDGKPVQEPTTNSSQSSVQPSSTGRLQIGSDGNPVMP